MKPVDNMGARGVKRVETRRARGSVPTARALSRSSRVIIEEFMEGPEFSLDAVVHQGKVTVCGVADRHILFPPSFVEMGHTMPTEVESGDRPWPREGLRGRHRALGIDNGAAKGDIKLTARGPMVGEIAARLSGGYMSGWTFPLSSGVEVTEAALNIAVGLPPGDLTPVPEGLRRAGPDLDPGNRGGGDGAEEARKCRGWRRYSFARGPGDEVVFPANNVQKCGNVIAVGEDRDEAPKRPRAGLCAAVDPAAAPDGEDHPLSFSGTGNDAFSSVRRRAWRAGSPRCRRFAATVALLAGREDPRRAPAGCAGKRREGLARHDVAGLRRRALRAGRRQRWRSEGGGDSLRALGLFWRAFCGERPGRRLCPGQRAGGRARGHAEGVPGGIMRRAGFVAWPVLFSSPLFAAAPRRRTSSPWHRDLGAVLEWDPLRDAGVISFGDDRISLKVGAESALINYRLKVRSIRPSAGTGRSG